jgi:nicotinamidase-related amidase
MPRTTTKRSPARPARAPSTELTPPSAAPGATLLAVDLQESLLSLLPPPAARTLRARASLALSAADTLGIPVVFTEQVPEKLGPTAAPLLRLAPSAPALPKNTFSALSTPAVLDTLRELHTEHLLLCGLETPICIYQTALGALAAGFQVTVLSDVLGARRPEDAATCLASLRHAGVHVLPTETVLYALLHDAAHPSFRDLVALVKNAARA